VLGLSLREIGSVLKAQIAPASRALGLIPSRIVGRANQHALERRDHGVPVE
jgi:hypothetical protein